MLLKKIKMFSGIFVVIIVMFSVMWIVFKIGIRNYVESEIQHELDLQIEKVESGAYEVGFWRTDMTDSYVADVDSELIFYVKVNDEHIYTDMIENDIYYYKNSPMENGFVPTNLIVTDDSYQCLTGSDDPNIDIINYYKDNPEIADEEEYRHIKIKKQDYYIMVRDNMGESKNMVYIVTATPYELYKFVDKVNLIFIVIMIILGTVLLLMSYRAGVKLERGKEKLRDYFQNASHELKTPIMSIQGYAEGISTNVIKNHINAADIILSESERMNALVQEILLLSKMDSGHADMRRQRLDIREVIYYCISLLEAEAEKKKIEFLIDINNDEEYFVLGNESQLEKAFLNILVNALRYAKHQVKIQLQRNKKWIKTDIIDDGQGIRESDMPHIFERFYKGESGGQHGIGLAIVKEIILLHKGKIKAVNSKGAKFSVWLRAEKKTFKH